MRKKSTIQNTYMTLTRRVQSLCPAEAYRAGRRGAKGSQAADEPLRPESVAGTVVPFRPR